MLFGREDTEADGCTMDERAVMNDDEGLLVFITRGLSSFVFVAGA